MEKSGRKPPAGDQRPSRNGIEAAKPDDLKGNLHERRYRSLARIKPMPSQSAANSSDAIRSEVGSGVYSATSEHCCAALIKSWLYGEAPDWPDRYHGRKVLRIGSNWAVGDDGEAQWLLLRNSGCAWQPRRYHVERDGLLRSIRELCGFVDPAAVDAIHVWPALYGLFDSAGLTTAAERPRQ